MAGKLRSHIRTNVVGYIALFFALSLGTAWAATELDKNEVKSKHIGKGQVKTKDLGKNSVTSPKVADGSLLNQDFAPGQLPQGERGPQGEQGPPGEPGGGSPTRAFSFRTSADTTANNLVNAGGLTIDVSCTGTVATATADTSVDNSTIYTASFDTGNSADPVDNQNNAANFDDVDPPIDLLSENDELQVGHTVYAAGTGGPVVNVHWSSDTTPNFDCLFVGHVTVG